MALWSHVRSVSSVKITDAEFGLSTTASNNCRWFKFFHELRCLAHLRPASFQLAPRSSAQLPIFRLPSSAMPF
jgi:hypothetical protein